MSPTGDAPIRRLHRRALATAASVALPLIVYVLWRSRGTVPHDNAGLVFVTFAAAILFGDLLLLGVSADRPRQAVLGLAVSSNVLLLVALVLFLLAPIWGLPVVLYLAFGQPLALLVLLVPAVARLLLVRSSLEVHRLLAAASGSRGWWAGVALSPGLLIGGLFPALVPLYLRWHPSHGSAAVAVRATRSLQGCIQRYAAGHGGRAPGDLAELGPRGARCLDASLASGNVPGWSVTLHGGEHLSLLVRERTLPLVSYRSYFSDASGELHTAGYLRRDATGSDPAATDVAGELERLHECMIRLQASATHRLPGSLWAMSQWRSACDVLRSARWRVAGDSNVAEVRTRFYDLDSRFEDLYRYEYRPWVGPDNHVDSAEVWARPSVYGETGLRSYLLTPSGEIHAAPQDRPARRTDPLAATCGPHEATPCAFAMMAHDRPRPPSDSAPVLDVAPLWQAQLAPLRTMASRTLPPAPVVVRGDMIIAAGQMGVYAYTPDGTRLWGRPDIGLVAGGAARGEQGTVFVVDSTNVLHALGANGWEAWRVSLGQQTRVPPAISGGLVYVSGGDSVFAVSTDGMRRWARPIAGEVLDMAPARGGVYVQTASDLRYFSPEGRVDGAVPLDHLKPCAGEQSAVSLSACHGAFRASVDAEAARRFVRIPAEQTARVNDQLVRTSQIADDGVVVGNWFGATRAIGPDLGTRWRVVLGENRQFPSAPVIARRSVVVVANAGLAGFDLGGTERWAADLHDRGLFSPPAVGRNGVVYVVGTNWILYAVRPPDPIKAP